MLKRKIITKHKAESPEDRPKKRRKVACDICHHHHKKCDGKNPCGRCTSKGYKCTYNQRRHSTIAALQKEIDHLKQKIHFYENSQMEFKKKMNTLNEESNALIHFEFEHQTIPLMESPIHTVKDFSRRFIYTDVTLHLCSIVSGFLNIYFATCYPHHYLLPSNFEQMIPELMKVIVTSPNERNDNVFLLFAIITNSALIFNDRRRAEEFFHRALECSQYLNFYHPSYALAYAYCHLSYFSTCYGRPNDAYSYSLMAKNMGEVLNMKDSDMYGEALMRMGFASQNIYEKQMLFTELWKRKSTTDKLLGALGLIATELEKENPKYDVLLNILQKCQMCPPPDWMFVFNMFSNGLLAAIYQQTGLHSLALETADKIAEYANNSEIKFSCVIATTFAMKVCTDIHFANNKFESIDNDLRLIGTFAHYPIGYELFQNVFNRLNEMKYPAVQLNLDPMTVQKDLEEKYTNLYGSFKNIIGDTLKEESTLVDDYFASNLVTLDLDFDSFINLEEQ